MLRGGFILNKIPDSIACAVDEICSKLNHRPILKKLFKNCFTNTLETTTELLEDGTTYVFTGDIPALWLRDSSAQVRHYIPFAKEDSEVQRIIEGLIKRQIMYILIDPYANAFNREANGQCYHKDVTDTNDWIWERKYEIDSLCYPIQLSYLYWKATDKTEIFDEKFKGAMHNHGSVENRATPSRRVTIQLPEIAGGQSGTRAVIQWWQGYARKLYGNDLVGFQAQ